MNPFLILYIVWYLAGLSGFLMYWLHEYGEVTLGDLVWAIVLFSHLGIILWIKYFLSDVNIHTREIIIFRRRK